MADTDTTTKRCGKCGETKSFSEFSKDKHQKDGLRSNCKSCIADDYAKYYSSNKEKILKKNAKWQAAHKDKRCEHSAKWRAENPDKAREAWTKYRDANRSKMLARSEAWRKANPENTRIRNQNRRAMEAGGTLSKGLALKLFKLQRGKCACGCKHPLGDDYHLDHIMPLALGGTNTDENIQLLRSTCNLKKHAKHPVDYMQSKGFLL